MRCFIAIPLPENIREEILNIQGQFKPLNLHAKWVEYQNLHVTLKFLGQVEQERIPEIKDIISKISSITQPFSLTLSETGAFPSLRKPRVLWVGIKPQEPPVRIINYLNESLAKIGSEPEKRKPHPHITIARIKSSKNIHKLEKILSYLKNNNLEWMVKEITLFKSILTSKGAVYERLCEVYLTDYI